MSSLTMEMMYRDFVDKNGTTYYKQMLEQSRQLWINVMSYPSSCFTLVLPGRTESFWKEFDFVKNMWKHRQELKVEDAGVAALFGLKCFAWFCAGEIIGRGFKFTGYYP